MLPATWMLPGRRKFFSKLPGTARAALEYLCAARTVQVRRPENWSYAQRMGPLSPNVKWQQVVICSSISQHTRQPALLWIKLQGNPFNGIHPDHPWGHDTAVNVLVTGGRRVISRAAQGRHGMAVGTVAFCSSPRFGAQLHPFPDSYLNSMWVK